MHRFFQCRKEVLEAVAISEKTELSPVSEMFGDVYDVDPKNLTLQKKQLMEHLNEYGVSSCAH